MNRRRMLQGVAVVGLAIPVAARAQQKGEYVKLRTALHELREARVELKEAGDAGPAGTRERAIASVDDAIGSLKGVLGVEDVEKFKGVDRGAEHYKKYKDFAHLRAALQELRDSRAELVAATADKGHLREKAVDDVDVAIGDILAMVRVKRR